MAFALWLAAWFRPEQLKAAVYVEPFVGGSGLSILWTTLDYMLETDGKIVETAIDYGLFTGEFGMAINFERPNWGFRPEFFIGYYKFHFWDIPSTAYLMLHGGGELYLQRKPFRIGYGMGYFSSVIYSEILGIQVSQGRYYPGSSTWINLAYIEDSMEISFRVRWHYFWSYEELRRDINDFVFVLRFAVPF